MTTKTPPFFGQKMVNFYINGKDSKRGILCRSPTGNYRHFRHTIIHDSGLCFCRICGWANPMEFLPRGIKQTLQQIKFNPIQYSCTTCRTICNYRVQVKSKYTKRLICLPCADIEKDKHQVWKQ